MREANIGLIKMIAFLTVIALIVGFFFFGCGAKAASVEDIIPVANKYRQLYENYFTTGNDLMDKIVNDHGDGYEPAYGLRNYRVVLHGVMYRSGSNNAYNKYGKRSNENPMPMLGMENLCKEGFSGANYMYTKNYIPYDLECINRWGEKQQFKYRQVSVLSSPTLAHQVLNQVYSIIIGDVQGAVDNSCYNGWHASGYISAVALIQFCGFTKDEATQYWIDGTGSVSNSNYPSIKTSIKNFIRNPKLLISDEVQQGICPLNPYHTL